MHFFTRSFRQTLERCCWFQAPPAAKKESSPLYCRPGRRTVRNGGESYFPAKLPASVGRSKEAAPHNFEKTDGQQQPQPHRQRPVAQLHNPPFPSSSSSRDRCKRLSPLASERRIAAQNAVRVLSDLSPYRIGFPNRHLGRGRPFP